MEAIGRELTRQVAALAIRSGVPRDNGCLVLGEETTSTGWTRPAIEALQPGFVVANGRVTEVRAAAGWAPGDDLMAAQMDFQGLDPEVPDVAVVLVDVWDRVETPAMSPALTDPAFLGAASSNRTRRMAQVKALPWTDAARDDASVRAAFYDDAGVSVLPRTGQLRLVEVAFEEMPDTVDPCDPCATEFAEDGIDAGNHLFRIEVHDSDFATARLRTDGVSGEDGGDGFTVKWSRDNGGLEVALELPAAQDLADDPRFAAAIFEITSVAGDQRQGLVQPNDDRRSALTDHDGLATAIAAPSAGAVARVWDGAARLRFVGGGVVTVQPVAPSTAVAEVDGEALVITAGNLAMRFEGLADGQPAGFVLPGDAWVIEIREFASPEPVPPGTDPDPRLSFRPDPVAIEHDYVLLGLMENGGWRFDDTTDVRDRAFPPLTDIAASEVSFDPSRVGGDAATVQEAIEDLYLNHAQGCGEIVIPANVDLAAFVERLRAEGALSAGADLKICLGDRDFEIETPISFTGLGHIAITGIGAGSRISATGAGALLAFRACDAVTLRDFAFDMAHQGGRAIDCERCREVEMRCRPPVAGRSCRAAWRHPRCGETTSPTTVSSSARPSASPTGSTATASSR